MCSIHSQRGVATIWYVFIIGSIMSLGALGIEGSRYITKKARLGDALEAASIAVASNDRVTKEFNADTKQDSGYSAKEVAKSWIHLILKDDERVELTTIKRKDASARVGIDELITPYKVDYVRYDIEAKTTHNSWLKFNSWASFDDQMTITNKGASGRIKGNHEPADVVFVADFSGSMKWCHHPDYGEDKKCRWMKKNKLSFLQDAIHQVTTTLYGVNSKSTFGFIPFSKRIVVNRGGDFYCVSPLLAPKGSLFDKVRTSENFPDLMRKRQWPRFGENDSRNDFYEDNRVSLEMEGVFESYIKWLQGKKMSNFRSGASLWSQLQRRFTTIKNADYPNPSTKFYYQKTGDWKWLNFANHIDWKRTASEITIEDHPMFGLPMPYQGQFKDSYPKYSEYCSSWNSYSGKPNYYNIERKRYQSAERLDEEFNSLISSMRANGGTDMYQGLLAAPHQFFNASNKNRYIIVLSDGAENSDSFERLVNEGMCENIKSELTEPYPGAEYNVKMFVVGIGFDPRNRAYNKCFNKDNIYPVHDLDKLKDVILGLFADEIGHNFER